MRPMVCGERVFSCTAWGVQVHRVQGPVLLVSDRPHSVNTTRLHTQSSHSGILCLSVDAAIFITRQSWCEKLAE